MRLLLLILTAVLFPLISQAQSDSVQFGEKKYDMRTYYLVLLKPGPNRTQDSVEAAKIQAGHLANISKLADAGKIVIAGPFLDDWDVKGIFIMNVESIKEAEKLVSEDPAVKTGRLIMEIHPWYSARGSCLP